MKHASRFRVFVVALVVAIGGGGLVPVSPAGAVGDLSTVNVNLTPVVSGLNAPLAAVWRPGDPDMYVVQQNGIIKRVVNGQVAATALTVKVSTGGEQGLLGLAFSANGTKAYINYTDVQGDTRVEEMPLNAKKKIIKAKRRLVFRQVQPFPNHNGGTLVLGPDGMLYVALGDGGGAGDPLGNGQSKNTLLGKILRINPANVGWYPYSVPSDNPFVGQSGARWEVWHYGLRNPWKFSFDRATGDMWIGDVGQYLYEEINFAPAGQKGINWGWNRREGLHSFNGGTQPVGGRDPIIERPHSDGDCSITGGYVYRGNAIPSLVGAYLYGDFCTGTIYAAEQQGGVAVQNVELDINVPQLVSFGQDASGELYAISRAGTIYRITG